MSIFIKMDRSHASFGNDMGPVHGVKDKLGYWLDLGLTDYGPAFAIQERILAARIAGRIESTFILQENPPVFTIGRSGSRNNILASEEDLKQRGIEVLDVNRGGDITYHGPGQIILSPLLYLGDIDMNANQYLHKLEDILIELLAGYDIKTGKKEGYPGVWLKDAKIAAVGIAVKHGYTFHGFSLNVNLDLEPYSLINPCGVERMPVSSMHLELGRSLFIGGVKNELRKILERTFSINTRLVSTPQIEVML